MEDTFKGADDRAVRIEVDGRIVTFAPAEVRAIYYGPAAAPAPVQLPEIGEPPRPLAMLRSVAQTGGIS